MIQKAKQHVFPY